MPDKNQPRRILLLGDGAWGTALAILLAEKGHNAMLWGKFPEYTQRMQETRVNEKFLPGVEIPENVELVSDMAAPMERADLLVVSTPVIYLRAVVKEAAEHHREGLPALTVAKGIENESLMRGSEIIRQELGEMNVGMLFGPSHAEEVARHLPSTVVAAAADMKFATEIQQTFMTDHFRVYTSDDATGVELGAALKNVIAIAAGLCDGLGLGDNSKAALITRGLAEISRLGEAMGARRSTFSGLTGLGDLVTTCVSHYGRNRAVGEAIGRGQSLDDTLRSLGGAVPEGVWTAKSVCALADKHKVQMPISREVHAILFDNKPPSTAVRDLMRRDAKPELD